MEKRRILILFGGCSPEHAVSLESVQGVLEALDRQRYVPVCVGITRQGRWLYFPGQPQEIGGGSWEEHPGCTGAALCPDRGSGVLLLFREGGVERLRVDAVLPILHGENGEDGTVQGLCRLAGLPLVGCGVLASALCMDKDRAHKLVRAAGVRVPRSALLERGEEARAAELAGALGYPVFVKPVGAGSSFGVSRVERAEGLGAAVEDAFRYGGQVLLEEAIGGFETGCAVMGGREIVTGEVDEIELQGGFFDFTEKYNLITSRIHVPARVDAGTAERLKETAKKVYRVLGCSGFARVDLFLTPEGEIVFNEVNTIPGFTAHSRFPQMMAAAGVPLREVLTRAIEEAVGA